MKIWEVSKALIGLARYFVVMFGCVAAVGLSVIVVGTSLPTWWVEYRIGSHTTDLGINVGALSVILLGVGPWVLGGWLWYRFARKPAPATSARQVESPDADVPTWNDIDNEPRKETPKEGRAADTIDPRGPRGGK